MATILIFQGHIFFRVSLFGVCNAVNLQIYIYIKNKNIIIIVINNNNNNYYYYYYYYYY